MFPRSLSEVYGNNWNNGVSQYAFGPGFINFNGADFPDQNTLLAVVTGNAAKGSRIIPVNDTSDISIGQVRGRLRHVEGGGEVCGYGVGEGRGGGD
jgi:hypothetical protein